MATESALDRGRASFDRRAWGAAFAELSAADQDRPLGADDLERLGTAAAMIGKEDDSDDARTRAHHEFLRTGDPPRAARTAFWLAMGLFNRGEPARGGGWLARARRLLDETGRECVEEGFLLIPAALQAVDGGDVGTAFGMFEEAAALAERFDDPDLRAMSRMGRGQCLILMGETAEGAACLDDVMVTVMTEALSPILTGIAYCALVDACMQMFDLRRAHEWTAALSRWTEGQPDMIPFRGQCLVHRATIMQLHGAWPEAVGEMERASELVLLPSGQSAAGPAFYRLAELRRLLGEFDLAEAWYRKASQRGESTQPGMALLRLVQGRLDAASAAIRREIDETAAPLLRCRLLPAFVETMLATGDLDAARSGAEELSGIASKMDAPYLAASSAHATGSVLLAGGDPRGALSSLRTASVGWQALDDPYDAARTKVAIALACRALGDEDSARMELEAARETFEALGARPDVAAVDRLLPTPGRDQGAGLTAREVEVLRLVAVGLSNREVAKHLVISEKTVARHVSNIFAKLGLRSRAAATAYAYEHGLV